MIVRLWHGKTTSSNAEEYMRYVMQTGVKNYRSTPGTLNAQLEFEPTVQHYEVFGEIR